jgi:hypothetical protein
MWEVEESSETLDFYSELTRLVARDLIWMGLTYISVLLSENKLN